MKNFIFKKAMYACILFVSLAFTSCSSDDSDSDGPSGSERITDATGLSINLIWTVNGSSTPLSEVDLDFFVLNSNDSEVIYSDNENSFEQEDFSSQLEDGTYSVYVEYFSGTKTAEYALTITGQSGGDDARVVTGSISNSGDSERPEINVLKIEKTGNTFVFK